MFGFIKTFNLGEVDIYLDIDRCFQFFHLNGGSDLSIVVLYVFHCSIDLSLSLLISFTVLSKLVKVSSTSTYVILL